MRVNTSLVRGVMCGKKDVRMEYKGGVFWVLGVVDGKCVFMQNFKVQKDAEKVMKGLEALMVEDTRWEGERW